MKKAPNKAALSQTTEEYASQSSIHGISYIFDKELHLVDRLLWLLVVVVFLGVAATMSWNFWSQWRNEQVLDYEIFALSTFLFIEQVYSFSAVRQNYSIQ